MWEEGSQKIVARMFPYFLLICCQGKVTTTLEDKLVRVNNLEDKTNLQIQGCGGGKGRRGGEHQDHPVCSHHKWEFLKFYVELFWRSL